MSSSHIGGQAIIEGVMMRGKKSYALAVRNTNGEIETQQKNIKPVTNKFYKLPIIRGIYAFVTSVIMGIEIINKSAHMAGLEEEGDPSKIEKFLTEKFGEKLNNILIGFSMALGFLISVVMFMILPLWLASFLNPIIGDKTYLLGVFEGIIRILIFIVYIYLISRSEDVQRIFMYHGAEHKTINCLENDEELTIENVKKHSRLHKRCGTSFLILVMLVSILFFMFIKTDVLWLRFVSRLLIVPFLAGVSYEIIRWAGSSNSLFVNIVSYPGIKLQLLTTKEPDDDQIEVAIKSTELVLKKEV